MKKCRNPVFLLSPDRFQQQKFDAEFCIGIQYSCSVRLDFNQQNLMQSFFVNATGNYLGFLAARFVIAAYMKVLF